MKTHRTAEDVWHEVDGMLGTMAADAAYALAHNPEFAGDADKERIERWRTAQVAGYGLSLGEFLADDMYDDPKWIAAYAPDQIHDRVGGDDAEYEKVLDAMAEAGDKEWEAVRLMRNMGAAGIQS